MLIEVIGFKKRWLKIESLNAFYDVSLEENAQLLGEITVKPEDNALLYKLLEDCRKKQSGKHQTSKVYYELKSFVENQQVELVENFYNGSIYGYELDGLALKTGRIALRDFDQTFFGSMESSRAIIMFKLFNDNAYFPTSPFELREKKFKDQFYLRLQGRYLDDRRDSIYVVDFVPRDKSGTHFSGSIWINLRTKGILKTELHCEHARRHPFLPLFPSDTIQNLDLHITSSFEEIDGKMFFRHIDFSYETTYQNRSNATYKAFTQAILYAYDFGREFVLPKFNFAEVSDFKKISAVPYNAYFWKNHDELKTSDQQGQNEKFYNDPRSTTNRSIFTHGKFDRGIYESSYLTWNGKRIRLREFSADQTEKTVNPRGGIIVSELYNLSASIYMDINQYKDSLQVTTTTVFDPYKATTGSSWTMRLCISSTSTLTSSRSSDASSKAASGNLTEALKRS